MSHAQIIVGVIVVALWVVYLIRRAKIVNKELNRLINEDLEN